MCLIVVGVRSRRRSREQHRVCCAGRNGIAPEYAGISDDSARGSRIIGPCNEISLPDRNRSRDECRLVDRYAELRRERNDGRTKCYKSRDKHKHLFLGTHDCFFSAEPCIGTDPQLTESFSNYAERGKIICVI